MKRYIAISLKLTDLRPLLLFTSFLVKKFCCNSLLVFPLSSASKSFSHGSWFLFIVFLLVANVQNINFLFIFLCLLFLFTVFTVVLVRGIVFLGKFGPAIVANPNRSKRVEEGLIFICPHHRQHPKSLFWITGFFRIVLLAFIIDVAVCKHNWFCLQTSRFSARII